MIYALLCFVLIFRCFLRASSGNPAAEGLAEGGALDGGDVEMAAGKAKGGSTSTMRRGRDTAGTRM